MGVGLCKPSTPAAGVHWGGGSLCPLFCLVIDGIRGGVKHAGFTPANSLARCAGIMRASSNGQGKLGERGKQRKCEAFCRLGTIYRERHDVCGEIVQSARPSPPSHNAVGELMEAHRLREPPCNCAQHSPWRWTQDPLGD